MIDHEWALNYRTARMAKMRAHREREWAEYVYVKLWSECGKAIFRVRREMKFPEHMARNTVTIIHAIYVARRYRLMNGMSIRAIHLDWHIGGTEE